MEAVYKAKLRRIHELEDMLRHYYSPNFEPRDEATEVSNK